MGLQMGSRRKLILETISDSVIDIIHYNRKEDEELRLGEIQQAIKNNEITVEEIVDEFRKEFIKWI